MLTLARIQDHIFRVYLLKPKPEKSTILIIVCKPNVTRRTSNKSCNMTKKSVLDDFLIVAKKTLHHSIL